MKRFLRKIAGFFRGPPGRDGEDCPPGECCMGGSRAHCEERFRQLRRDVARAKVAADNAYILAKVASRRQR